MTKTMRRRSILVALAILLVLAGVLWAAAERFAPDAIVTQTNLTGALTDIDEDPDTPDANWLTQTSGGANTVLRVSFATPSDTLTSGSGLQEFKIQVRSGQLSGFAGNGTETYDLFLYEGGVEVSTLATAVAVSDASPQTDAYTWNAALLSDSSGAAVELRMLGTVASGGGPAGSRAAIEVGAVEWNAEVGVGLGKRRAIVIGAQR